MFVIVSSNGRMGYWWINNYDLLTGKVKCEGAQALHLVGIVNGMNRNRNALNDCAEFFKAHPEVLPEVEEEWMVWGALPEPE